MSLRPASWSRDSLTNNFLNIAQGLSQQLSNLQIRRVFERNFLINRGNWIQHKDSCKLHSATGYRVYLPAIQPCTVTSTGYRGPTGYWLHSLVHLLQQLITTECTDRLLAKQPCTDTSITGLSVPTGYWPHILVVHLLQQLITECTDRLPAKQPCTVTSITGLSVPTGYWLHSLVHFLQQLVTECTDRLPAKQPGSVTPITGYSVFTDRLPASQPYTVASSGYSVLAGYRLHSLVQLFQQLVPSTQPALNSLSHITEPPCLPTSTKNHNLKVSYQLTTPHQQPIHRPKPDDGPNNV